MVSKIMTIGCTTFEDDRIPVHMEHESGTYIKSRERGYLIRFIDETREMGADQRETMFKWFESEIEEYPDQRDELIRFITRARKVFEQDYI